MSNVMASLLDFTWGMSLFSVQQAVTLVALPFSGEQAVSQVSEAVEAVTSATKYRLNSVFGTVYELGSAMQDATVDTALAALTLNPIKTMDAATQTLRQSFQALFHMGWVEIPPPPIAPAVDEQIPSGWGAPSGAFKN
jgi:hypothetical protein